MNDLFFALLPIAALMLLAAVFITLTGALVRALLRRRAPARAAATKVGSLYARTPTLLTPAEQLFFSVLRTAVPDGLIVCPQVRLANLVHPTARDQRRRYADFNRIQAKCVDFVLCDARTTAPRLVVELDDASHQRADRQARDAFVDLVLQQVALPILHVPCRASYDVGAIATPICAALGLPAPTASVAPDTTRWAPAAPVFPPLPPASLGTAPARSAPPAAPAVRWACRSCGAEVGAAAKYCRSCGALLEL